LPGRQWLRALGWDMVICCDGLPAVRVPPMTGISFEIEPDPRHWLHMVEIEGEGEASG